jgi:hypothetical protein
MDFYEQAISITSIETGVEESDIRSWFASKLITPEDIRDSVKQGENNTGGLPNSAIKELDRQHIIRPQPRGGSIWYELSHDRFIPPIKKSNEEWEKSFYEYLKPIPEKQIGHEINDFKDSFIERLLVRGERSVELELYFGEELFSEIRQLAQETSIKSSDEGPRVLIIPEIMGSKLGKEGKVFDDIIWLDPIDLSRGNLSELSLNQRDKHFKVMGVFLYAYLKLKLILISAGYNVDFFPYDWRHSINKSGGILAKRINKEDHDTIHLVCHGMGGLVARAAAFQNSHKIGYIVMLGCPNYGSYMPIQLFRSVYPTVHRLASVDKTNSPESMVEKVFSNFPSLYDMLPIASKSGNLDFFNIKNWPSVGWRPLQSYLDLAKLTYDSLAMADERYFVIAGVNQETVTGIKRKDQEFIYQYSTAGDGTVPLSLAELDNCTTYFIEESHGSLPNNRSVAKAISEILAKGSTDLLLKSWTFAPTGVIKEVVESEIKQAWYDPVIKKSISFREQRQLLEELVSSRSHDFAQPTRYDSAAIPEFRHRLDLRLALGSITDVKAQIYVVGLYDGVNPSGPVNAIDSMLGGAIEELVIRRQITVKIGQIKIIPTGTRTRLADFICFVGLGPFDAINEKVIETITGNLISTLIRLRIDDFATVIFGGSSGLNVSRTIEFFLKGLFRSIRDVKSDHRLQSFTICEVNRDRYESIKREIYAFSGRPGVEQIYLNIKEISLSPIISLNLTAHHRKGKREPVYLTVRCDQAEMSLNFVSTVLTSGQNAVIVQGRQQIRLSVLQKHLEKISSRNFTFPRLLAFGHELNELVLHPDVVSNLKHFSENHLVIIHDRLSSLIPWETINFGGPFPAATGGLSRRYLAGNLSVAKWLEHRKFGPRLDVLLVVNPTGDLPGAADEGRRIQELFGDYTSTVNLKVLEESQARKKVLLELFSSGEYDVVHYAGHAYFDPLNPDSSGILCPGREVLSSADLAGIGNLPALMFFNACEAARVRKPHKPQVAADPELSILNRIQHNVGLAEAFLRGGVANYLGNNWPVGDAPAKRFAEVFYSDLLQGKTIGESLLEARKELQANRWVDWVDYVLYGSPEFVLKIPSTYHKFSQNR